MNSGHALLLCCWSKYLPKDNTLPLHKFFKTVPYLPLSSLNFCPRQCLCRFHRRIPAQDSAYLRLPSSNSCPSQCLFDASAIEFLQFQDSAYSPLPPSNSCKSKSVPIRHLRPWIPASPSQCLFAASAVEFLQIQANAPQRVSVARGFHSLY